MKKTINLNIDKQGSDEVNIKIIVEGGNIKTDNGEQHESLHVVNENNSQEGNTPIITAQAYPMTPIEAFPLNTSYPVGPQLYPQYYQTQIPYCMIPYAYTDMRIIDNPTTSLLARESMTNTSLNSGVSRTRTAGRNNRGNGRQNSNTRVISVPTRRYTNTHSQGNSFNFENNSVAH